MSNRIKSDDEIVTVQAVRQAINRHIRDKRDRDGIARELLIEEDA